MLNFTNHQGNTNPNQNESHLIPDRTYTIKQTRNKVVKQRLLLCIVGENVNWCSHYQKQYGGFSKIEYKYHVIHQFYYNSTFYTKDTKILTGKYTCTPIFIAAFFKITKTWKQLKCLLME